MTFYLVVCFTKIYFSKRRLLYIKKRITESVPLDRHVVYIKFIPEKSLLLFQAEQIV